MAPDNGDLQHAQAFECNIYPAVNTYGANITNGVLLEQVLGSQRMDIFPAFVRALALLVINDTIRAGEWHHCSSSQEPSDEHNFAVVYWPDPPGTVTETGPILGTDYTQEELNNRTSVIWNLTKWWPKDCVYSMGHMPTQGLMNYLTNFLGNETLMYDVWESKNRGNLWSVNIWNEGRATLETVQTAMDGLSKSITARLRQGDTISNNLGPVVGTAWESQTCVHVNWVWITLPAGLLLFTIIFLVLTILKTRASQTQAWKSSIFAILFSGLGQEARQAAGPVTTLEQMRSAADRTSVRLENTKEGVRLVGQI